MISNKKLIEVALPLQEINAACKADKARATGTIRNLHKWFAPMPLPAWRALIFAALLDDPEDDERRAYLLDVIKRLVANGALLPDHDVLAEAADLLAIQYPDGLPVVIDPFCGGASTLVEGQRLGLATYGSDLNPVPVLISRTLTQLLPSVWGLPPLHPEVADNSPIRSGSPDPYIQDSMLTTSVRYEGYEGLVADVKYYAKLIRDRVANELQPFYPLVRNETPIAWLWVRTAFCPNPACGLETLLTTSWWLSKKKSDLAWIEPTVVNGNVTLKVVTGQASGDAPEEPKIGRGASFRCLSCNGILEDAVVAAQGQEGRLGLRLAAVIAERDGKRIYREPTSEEIQATESVPAVEDFPEIRLPDNPRWFSGPRFGLTTQADLYTPRQLLTLTTFADSVAALRDEILQEGASREWADAIVTLLALVLGKFAQAASTQARTETRNDGTTSRIHAAFGRNDLPMTWDFAEVYFASGYTGDWLEACDSVLSALDYAPRGQGLVVRADAREVNHGLRGLVATDPPYFDAIGYADLSDYFYVWHRRVLRNVFPDLYATVAAPKSGELTAVPAHHGNSKEAAREYFVEGFTETFRNLQGSLLPSLPLLVVYASKEQKGGNGEETRWSSILTAMVEAGLEITGTWPIHGTGDMRLIGRGTNSVATYVVMASRPRDPSAGSCSLADFNRSLRRELKPAIHDLQAAGILPVDLAQAAMGPGMQIYSRHREVVDQTGERVSVEKALRLINAALGEVLDEQEGELDPDSRFAVAWWEKHGWEPATFGEADQLARPQGISVDDVIRAGVATYPKAGFVAVVGNRDLNRDWLPSNDSRPTAWEAVHHLADRLVDGGGVMEAGRLMSHLGVLRDPAQALVYRLHDIAARKGRTKDQERYNALIGSWSDLLAIAATEKDGLF